MSNVLSEEKKQQIVGLGRLGWSLRRIERETGIHRETATRYLTAAGISIRKPGRPSKQMAKPAISTPEVPPRLPSGTIKTGHPTEPRKSGWFRGYQEITPTQSEDVPIFSRN